MEITVGMKGEVSTLVEREDTAKEVGSGDLLVYATPCMVALMEGAACEALAPVLKETETTVGTMLNIKPIIYLNEEGRLINISKVRGRKASIQALAKKMEELQELERK